MNHCNQIDPITGLPRATPFSYNPSFNFSWDQQYQQYQQLNFNYIPNHRKRELSEVDLTHHLKKLKLEIPPDSHLNLCEIDVDRLEEPCYSQEQEPRIYIDDSYLELTNRLPTILLRHSPSFEAEYVKNRQLILYRPFIWTLLFDQLFKSLESSDVGAEPMDCDEPPSISFQAFIEEPMECEDCYYGEPMEID